MSCQDDAFGPAITGCRGDFDFTWLFEQAILSIVPSSLLLLLAVPRIWSLWARKRFVAGTSLQLTKLAAIGCYGIVQLGLLVLWIARDREARVTLAAATLSLVNSFALAALSWLEHTCSPRPSALLSLYLLISVLFDATETRTLWLQGANYDLSVLFSLSLAIKLCLFALESVEKGRYLPPEWQDRSPEEKVGVFNHNLLLWLRHILWKGRNSTLTMLDLFDLDPGMKSSTLFKGFIKEWKTEGKSGTWSTVFALYYSMKWSFLAPVLPRLAEIGFTICQPFLLQELLNYLQHGGAKSTGYGLIGAYALVFLGTALSTCVYWRLVHRSLVQLRGCLGAAIYKKTLRIDASRYDMNAPITLVSNDIDRIMVSMTSIHEVWANTIQVAISVWILYNQLGLACIAPPICTIICCVAAISLNSSRARVRLRWLEATQKRVGVTAKAIASMKLIRLLGLSDRLHTLIAELRLKELRSARSLRLIQTCTAVVAYAPLQMAPILTFLIFVLTNPTTSQTLDSTRIFTAISWLQLMTEPLKSLFQMIPIIVASSTCYERIVKFLHAQDRIDTRHFSLSDQDRSQTEASSLAVGTPESLPFDLSSNTPIAIAIRDGEFGWSDAKPVLKDIHVDFPTSKLTMIIGPVASGKSTLCRAIVGELPVSKGHIYIQGTNSVMAYCDQEPFLFNGSVRENIIAFADYDAGWYDSVIHAVALADDIATWPDGDAMLVGSGGTSLSGGQRQRVSIARAVYAKLPIAIFDDVLSGLDAATKDHLFKSVFGPQGLLKQAKSTVVICTHDIDLLPESDHIVALGMEGQVVESGPYTQLAQEAGYVSSFALRERQDHSGRVDRKDGGLKVSALAKLKQEEAALADDSSRRLGDFSVWKFFFAAIGPLSLVMLVFSQVGAAVFSTVGTAWLNLWSVAIDSGFPDNGYYLGVFAVFQVLGLVFLGLSAGHVLTVLAVTSGRNLHGITLDSVMRAPISFFSTTDTGVTLNRFSQDISLIDRQLPLSLLLTGTAVLLSTAQMILIAIGSPFLAITYPFILGVFYLVQNFYLRTSRQLRYLDLESKSPLYTQFLETVQGAATIRTFGWSRANIATNYELLDNSQKPVYLLYMIQQWLQLILDIIVSVMAIILVSVATNLPPASTGFIGVALVNLMSISQRLKDIVVNWANLETSLSAVARTKSFKENTPSEHKSEETETPPHDWPSSGELSLKSLSGTYDASNPNQPVFQDVNIEIKAGEKVAICGRSGSGKSSLVLAIARMVELTHGSIVIDGLDLSTLSRTAIRSQLNIIPQDFYYMDGSVSYNLDPYGTSGRERMRAVLESVCLWTTVEATGGLDAKLSYSGLSQGQKQQFALARALLRPSKVVLLDEATSSVDRDTDAIMQRVIRDEFRGKTVLAVAHRLDTILDFDRVVVMAAGKVVESGQPKELQAREDSAFGQLCRTQGIRP